MSIKYKDIVPSIQTLNKISNEKLPVKVAYIICKIIDAIQKELEFYNKSKNKLLDTLCRKNEDGSLAIKDGGYDILDVEKWNKEIEELLNIEIDSSNIPGLEIDKLESLEMTALEVNSIKFLFDITRE